MVVQMVLFIYFNCSGSQQKSMCVNTLSLLIPWFVLPSRKTVTTAHFTDTDQGHQNYLLFSLSPHPPLRCVQPLFFSSRLHLGHALHTCMIQCRLKRSILYKRQKDTYYQRNNKKANIMIFFSVKNGHFIVINIVTFSSVVYTNM